MTILATDEVVETPIWFGPKDRPLFGWITWPASPTAAGGLVIAPTVGREARAGHRAIRRMAVAAAERGLVALRLDYEGTGDSAGSFGDPNLDQTWTDSVASSVDELRSLGLTSVSAIGMRLGATIVGSAADRRDLGLSSLVLWDPCESGRTYLRELGALETFRHERDAVAPAGDVTTAEHVFSSERADELRRLDLTTIGRAPLAPRILVVSREDRSTSGRLQRRLDEEKVEWTTTNEQGALLDIDPLFAVVPERTISTIVEWLADGTGAEVAIQRSDEPAEAVLSASPDEVPVRERCVAVGARRLFGIVCEPIPCPPEAALVVFLNVANEDHTGPSRLWVELSRRWAAHGLRCVRFDLSGIGDSPACDEQAGPSIYDRAWLEDTTDVARHLSAEDPTNTVFVGLCSGAYWAVEAGTALRSRGVCVINPPVGIDFLHGVTRLAASRFSPVRAIAGQLKTVALRLRWVAVVLWKFLRLLAPSVFSVDVMGRLADGGTDLFVLASSEDLSPFPKRERLARFFSRRLVAPANYKVTFVPGLDHSLHAPEGRARAIELLDRHVLESYVDEPKPQDLLNHDAEERS